MTDRTRGAIFNSLTSLGALENAVIYDLFAGTGAMGIEALSRGAARCTFVERDAATVGVIHENLVSVGLNEQAEVIRADVLTFLRRSVPVDIAIVAPPYAFDDWGAIIESLRCGVMVCESDRPLAVPPGWSDLRTKNYGQTIITMLEPKQ
jgi:16S rRNA (guanine966-N2)-methyltransferase